jgi:hypothetical protein
MPEIDAVDTWFDKYQPKPNLVNDIGFEVDGLTHLFGFNDEDFAELDATAPEYIWTYQEADDGSLEIVSGRGDKSDSIGYFITTVAAPSPGIKIIVNNED